MLLEQGRVSEALAVLDRAERPGAKLAAHEATALVDARLAALGRTRSWDAMARLAEQGGSPGLRLQVADALEQVGRAPEAREIRKLACAGLDPAPKACSPR
jgi:thioredoxin-like negative regulator of GroEL